MQVFQSEHVLSKIAEPLHWSSMSSGLNEKKQKCSRATKWVKVKINIWHCPKPWMNTTNHVLAKRRMHMFYEHRIKHQIITWNWIKTTQKGEGRQSFKFIETKTNLILNDIDNVFF